MIKKLITLLTTLTVIISCSSNPPPVLGNKNYDSKPAKIIIIPMDGVDNNLINNVSNYIQDKHNLKTKVYPHMGYSDKMFNPETEQYYAEAIASSAVSVFASTSTTISDKAIIVITDKDINHKRSTLRFVFSSHYNKFNLSVISTARINTNNYGLDPDGDLLTSRLYKLVNKSLGLNYYKYKQTNDRSSVMYGPILGVQDLDVIGDWYIK